MIGFMELLFFCMMFNVGGTAKKGPALNCQILAERAHLGGGNSNIFNFHLYLGKMNPF